MRGTYPLLNFIVVRWQKLTKKYGYFSQNGGFNSHVYDLKTLTEVFHYSIGNHSLEGCLYKYKYIYILHAIILLI